MANAEENRVVAVFKNHTIRNEAKSKEAGRPIYDDMEVCEIRFAANRQTVGVFPAHSFSRWENTPEGTQEPLTYAMRWPEQYKRFKMNQQQVADGTPLEELPFLTQGKRLELKALSVHTAETLAALDGQELKTLGIGGRELKNQAQAYLDNAKSSAGVTKLAAENEGLKEQLRLMQEQINALGKQGKSKIVGRDEVGEDDAAAQSEASQFNGWEDADIKDYIKSETGAAPRGNPSHETLVKMADEIEAGKAE